MKKFLRRKSDGKFYRGARLWKWCRSWRNAAVLPELFWKEFLARKINCEYELVSIEEIDT